MKIKILRGTVCGGVSVDPGMIVEASDADAYLLLRMGKAEIYDGDDIAKSLFQVAVTPEPETKSFSKPKSKKRKAD